MIPIIKIDNYKVAMFIFDKLKSQIKSTINIYEDEGIYVIEVPEQDADSAREIAYQIAQTLIKEEQNAQRQAWSLNDPELANDQYIQSSRKGSLIQQFKNFVAPATMIVALICVLTTIGIFTAPEDCFAIMSCQGFALNDPASWYHIFTPIFMHFSLMHIGFNLVMWCYISSQIEKNLGIGTIIALLLITAVIPNYSQYISTGANFGGISGVINGLIGFCWIVKRLGNQYYQNIFFPEGLFTVCVIVDLLGLLDILPGFSTANIVHIVGLACGIIFGLYHTLVLHPKRQA